MRLLRSSALSLAVGYVVLGLAALALFATPLWYAWHETIQEGRAEVLHGDAQRLTEVFRRDGAAGLVNYVRERVGLQIVNERFLLVTDRELHVLAGNMAVWPTSVPAALPGDFTITLPEGAQRVDVDVVHVVLPGDYHLLVGRDRARLLPLERRFWTALAGAVAILSVLGLIGGLMVRREFMERIHVLRATVSAITEGDLKSRLPTRTGRDELNVLAQTINGLLDQIEQLVHGVRNVSNAIAHDLRTPLAELRSRLEELTLLRPPSAQTFDEIEAAVADVDRVIRIFDALLRLAELDNGLRRSGFVAVDLAGIAAAAAEFYQPAAELKASSLQFDASPPAWVRGDPVLLAQALGNLIDNSLKYTPEGGTIHVSVVHRGESEVEVAVSDSGPGIAAEDKPKVVERFYRGDASRGTPGVGLGLSLVAAVARLHGSALVLEDNQPGLRARFVLLQDTHFARTARAQ